jgi:ABC-type phosphate transport system substrate-binding protein
MGFGRKSWLRYRVIIYAVVAVGVFLYRNHIDWSRLVPAFVDRAGGDLTLVIGGRDLAPDLVDVLVEHYRRDYPDLAVSTLPGGTNQALEDLVNGRADAAFLTRAPTPAEQDLFREVDGDTAIVMPVGVGAILILAGVESLPGNRSADGLAPVTLAQLAGLMGGDMQGLGDRFYAADPNHGQWAAAAQLLERSADPADDPAVVYLADDAQVVRAVASDPRALGMIASFDLPAAPRRNLPAGEDATAGPALVPVRETSSDAGFAATYENVVAGDYPLYVSLFVACRADGDIQGGKFVTHLSSGRGQRQVERAGCIPARQVPHEVFLTTRALGE